MKNLTKIVMLILCVIYLSACATYNYPTGNPFANQGKLKFGIRYSDNNPGIYVQAVQFHSIAYNAGIKRGDIILTAGNTTIQNAMHFQQILQTITGKVKFGIIGQGGVIKTITVDFGGTTTKKWTKESAIAYTKIYKEILTNNVFPLPDKIQKDAIIAYIYKKEGYTEGQKPVCNQKGEYYICEISYLEKDITIGIMSKNSVFFQLYLWFNCSDGPVEHMLMYGITKENIIHMTTGECAEPMLPTDSTDSGREATSRDGTLIAYATGVVRDTKTGIEWLAGPDRNMTWNEAKSWVENLTVDGGGWRMPTRKELKSLYKEGTRNMTPLLKTTGWRVWSGETKGWSISSAWGVAFGLGHEEWYGRRSSSHGRAFAVRSRR